MPRASIVIPAYNAERLIARVLNACLAQDLTADVIVVDDGSSDRTSEIVRRYPVQYVYQANQGPAQARNTGWRMARGDIICFTDSDCVPAPDWVSRLVERHVSPQIAGVGGTYDIANPGNLLATCVQEEIVQRHLGMPEYVDFLGSFNVAYRRDVLEEVGGFDTSYQSASGEDNDLAYRVARRGYRLVFTRDAKVSHYHPENLWRYLRQQFWHGYWRMKLYREHPRMARGDVYGGILDFLRPPLALATACLVPFCFLPPVLHLLSALLVMLLSLSIPMALAIVGRTRQVKYLAMIPLTFLRSYARGGGLVAGVLSFFVLWRS